MATIIELEEEAAVREATEIKGLKMVGTAAGYQVQAHREGGTNPGNRGGWEQEATVQNSV